MKHKIDRILLAQNYFNIRMIFLLIILNVLISFSVNYLFITKNIYYQSFSDQLTIDRITKMIELSEKWRWIGFIVVPLVILIRISFTSICLYTGYFLSNLNVRFKDLFKVALLSDFVFVLAGILKLIILIFFKEVNTLNDLQFQPLSLQELLGNKYIDALFTYPFSLISGFELLYWLSLAWLLTGIIEKPFSSALKTVASSYGTGLALWVLFIMFLTINLT